MLAPEVVGRRVLQAIQGNEFLILSRTREREAITDAVMPTIDRS
jgi:hypothetical protein